jgi:hypothetical protein
MPKQALQYLSKDVVEATISVADNAFVDEGYTEVDKRVWTADVPDYALDPWCRITTDDVGHSTSYETKDSPVEVHFVSVDLFATEVGVDTPYDSVESLAKRVVQNMSEGFSVSGHTVHEVRVNVAEPISLTGPEQTDLFGRGLQFEVHLE